MNNIFGKILYACSPGIDPATGNFVKTPPNCGMSYQEPSAFNAFLQDAYILLDQTLQTYPVLSSLLLGCIGALIFFQVFKLLRK